MKRIVLTALLMSSPAFAAPHVVQREIQPRVPFGQVPASDRIRAYAMAGTFSELGGKSCNELFDALFDAVLPKESEVEHMYFAGLAVCSSDVENGPAIDLDYQMTVEAITEDDMELVEAYLAAHQDVMVEGNSLAWTRVFGVFAELQVTASFIADDGVETVQYERTLKRLHVNQAQAAEVSGNFAESLASADDFLAWYGSETSKIEALFLQLEILPQSNLVHGHSDSTLILEDRRTIYGNYDGPYALDCRESANGYCL